MLLPALHMLSSRKLDFCAVLCTQVWLSRWTGSEAHSCDAPAETHGMHLTPCSAAPSITCLPPTASSRLTPVTFASEVAHTLESGRQAHERSLAWQEVVSRSVSASKPRGFQSGKLISNSSVQGPQR